ncbi:Stk1 family PASTA domain-containing Ser/Thr kinase [Haematomicrobium sanguinis]|uniref:Stk1 family PASTA domain-containing Ser/Thr kinase n=1 Tax=Haematomicrobium sanguinis TaxID=479106 RepID=UPI000478C7BE|nr:PASTA domain-containing protein [Haematomicrobium sanguinis]
MQENATDHLTGTILDGRYRVNAKLARGGMSTVYVATAVRLERDVALKVLLPHLAMDPQAVDRFEREAKSAARLSHPHVVGVIDQGIDGDVAYLVMEYVPGSTLRELLQDKGALTPRQALALIDPVVEGLAAAHEAGLIHRDIKPENVLLGHNGSIKLADFGLSRAVTAATQTATLVGTVGYLSPELVQKSEADTRSDVYAVGVMLYELLTGSRPFTGDMAVQVAFEHVNSPLPDPLELAPGLPEELVELLQQATEKNPDDRPVDASALLEELRHLRSSLTPEELDAVPPAARKMAGMSPTGGAATNSAAANSAADAPPADHSAATEVLGSPTGAAGALSDDTVVLHPESGATGAGGENPTTIMNAGFAPTTALDLQPKLSLNDESGPVLGNVVQTDPNAPDAAPRPLSKREAKAARKLAAKQAATPTHELENGQPRRRAALWIIVIALLAVLGGIAAWFFGAGPGVSVTIPEVRGANAQEATATLEDLGLPIRTQEVFDEEVASGKAAGTEPGAQSSIRRFEGITLLISKGPQLFAVPDLAGKSQNDASNMLADAGLSTGAVTQEYSDTVPEGQVISQDPKAQAQVRGKTPVALVISRGVQPVPVPDLSGKTVDEATTALADVGLKIQVTPERVFDKNVPDGKIVSQDPATGAQAPKGSAITVVVSKGPRMIDIPQNLVGKQEAEVKRALEQLGFTVEVQRYLGGIFGTVRSIEPSGPSAPEGSTITLLVV